MKALLDLVAVTIPSFILRFLLFITVSSVPLFITLSNFDLFEQYMFPLHYLQGNVHHVSTRVLVGHYPDYALLRDLNQQGVKIIISLLNDGLVYEGPLIRQEMLRTKYLGLKEFNFKMDSSQPANSPLNSSAMENIKMVIAANPNAKIFIHCYLGRHRAGYVERALQTSAIFSAS